MTRPHFQKPGALPAGLRRIIPVLLLLTTALAWALDPAEERLGFAPLSDGKTFAGWKQEGNWEVQDGAFVRVRSGGQLVCVKQAVPDDFELRFEWNASKGCNSGVYYRPGQVEYQILDDDNSPYGENPRQSAASLFFCMAPAKRSARPFGNWNTARIVCKGSVIEHWLNEARVLSFDYADPKWAAEVELLRIRGGHLNARGGNLLLQDHGQDVSFRNLRLRTIPADEALVPDPNFHPMPVPAEALVKEQARVKAMLEKAKEHGPLDDAAWLRERGTLVFHDPFERTVSGNLMKAIGNGWESATADRVPQIRQADIESGTLKIASATKEAGHAAHIHHDAGFEDGGAQIRFRFPGLNPNESLQLGFVDRELKGVHAGHLCYALLNQTSVTLIDSKTGTMNLENRKRREEAVVKKKPVPADLEALLKTKQTNTSWKADNEWHDLILVTEGDQLRVSMDGKPVLQWKSEGFAHPMKRWFSFLVASTVWVDDVKIWKVK